MIRFILFATLCIILTNNLSFAKRFKKHGRYEQIAKHEYVSGIKQLNEQSDDQPDQILTSLTGIEGMIAVTWVTMNETSNNQSIYWGYEPNKYTFRSPAQSHLWIDPSSSWNNVSIDQSIKRTMHQSMMTNLKFGSKVYYRVGSIKQSNIKSNELDLLNHLVNRPIRKSLKQTINGVSDELIFKMIPTSQTNKQSNDQSNNQVVTLIIYGDMGVVNAQSMNLIRDEIQNDQADMILHLGDYAYDLHTNNGTLGDVFMHNLSPISSRVPYLGCEGNHEGKYNASHFTNRFWAYNQLGRTSRSDTNWWFSWNYVSGGSLVHFVSLNTELYYTYVDEFTPPNYSAQRQQQYKWLKQDLQKARSNGASWIFVYGHRPLYCSDVDSLGDCTSDATLLREGWPGEQNGIDAILAEFQVDIYFTAHEHSYERTFPVSFGKIDLTQSNHTYVNPKYPVHIITGSAGCSEELEWFDPVNFAAWSNVRSPTYGYGHLKIFNSTHLYWDQLIDEGRQGKDHLWIIKDSNVKRLDEVKTIAASE